MKTSIQTRAINAQTAGPLSVSTSKGDAAWHPTAFHVCTVEKDALSEPVRFIREALPEAEARLLASSYTAFDRAGRSLGIDAAELAEKIDLAALIRVAINAQSSLARLPNTDGAYRVTCWKQISDVLAPFPSLFEEKIP